jgi:hypothetical protein
MTTTPHPGPRGADEPELFNRSSKCPLWAASWDASSQHSYASEEARCFAVTNTERRLWVLTKEVPGERVGLEHQVRFCMAAYEECPLFSTSESGRRTS